ncbi:MAG: hypothetical protein QG578_180 [Thermodesulfobacteriota bacterium]|nr:hypothetical protein [Thermodesulfobacteriota bacterium]
MIKKEGRVLIDRTYIVTMRRKRGMHADVYEDFEKDIIKYTGWKAVRGSMNILERVFEKYFLPRLKYRTFPFDLPGMNRSKIIFSSLSGVEYIKIFQRYIFKSKLKAIYQFDSWTHDNVINENAFRSFKINIVFFSIRKAAEYFNSLMIPDFKAYWMPEAVNCASCRRRDYGEKDIDILQYGRRWERLHEQLLPFCRTNAINYQFPIENGNAKIQFKDREALLVGLSKTRIAICVPRKITHPELYDLSTVTSRYFECMASKCLIFGHAPQDLIDLFGYNPVVEADYSDPAGQLKYLLDHYIDFVPMIEKNYKITEERHQWKNRIEDIKNILDENTGFKGTP